MEWPRLPELVGRLFYTGFTGWVLFLMMVTFSTLRQEALTDGQLWGTWILVGIVSVPFMLAAGLAVLLLWLLLSLLWGENLPPYVPAILGGVVGALFTAGSIRGVAVGATSSFLAYSGIPFGSWRWLRLVGVAVVLMALLPE